MRWLDASPGVLAFERGDHPAILIGLAIDFGVHLISRYEEELRHGATERKALELAMVNTGLGIFTGALTTVSTQNADAQGQVAGEYGFWSDGPALKVLPRAGGRSGLRGEFAALKWLGGPGSKRELQGNVAAPPRARASETATSRASSAVAVSRRADSWKRRSAASDSR